MQLELLPERAPALPARVKTPVKKHLCIKTWIVKDGRTAFEAGKEYFQLRSKDFAIQGENQICMWMDSDNYTEYFTTPTTFT